MPERDRVVELMYRKITGHDRWHVAQYEERRKLESGIDEDTHTELVVALDDLYLSIVDRVDWSRMLKVAEGRCRHQKHSHLNRRDEYYYTPICGDSLRDAMCFQEYGEYEYNGTDHYTAPKGLDWPKAIAKVLRKRKFLPSQQPHAPVPVPTNNGSAW